MAAKVVATMTSVVLAFGVWHWLINGGDIPVVASTPHSVPITELKQQAPKPTSHYDKWSPVGAHVEDQRAVVVTEGTFDEQTGAELGASTYRIWSDKATGLLLKYEYYDASGRVILEWEATSPADQPADDMLFQIAKELKTQYPAEPIQ